jgi:hypothetical protein
MERGALQQWEKNRAAANRAAEKKQVVQKSESCKK